jgi:hypothetical protein
MAKIVKSERVEGPTGMRVQVAFYDDDSVRFRIYECPEAAELRYAKELLTQALYRFKWMRRHDDWFSDVRSFVGSR